MGEASGELGLSSRSHNGTEIVTVSGELDIATAGELIAYAEEALRRAPRRLILEMGGVSFFGAAGVGVLVALAASAGRHEAELFLGEMSPSVTRVLRVLGLHERFPSAVSAAPAKSVQAIGRTRGGGLREPVFAAEPLSEQLDEHGCEPASS